MWTTVLAIYTILCFVVANGTTIFHVIGILSIMTIINWDIIHYYMQPTVPPQPEDEIPLEDLMELLEETGNIPPLG